MSRIISCLIGLLFISVSAGSVKADEINANELFLPHGLMGCTTGFIPAFFGMGDKAGNPYEVKFVRSHVNGTPQDFQWERWQDAVEKTLNKAFVKSAIRANAEDKLVVVSCSFRVSRTGAVELCETYPSPDDKLNKKIPDIIRSLEGKKVLTFPPGVKDEFVSVAGCFVQNYGPKYLAVKREAKSRDSASLKTSN